MSKKSNPVNADNDPVKRIYYNLLSKSESTIEPPRRIEDLRIRLVFPERAKEKSKKKQIQLQSAGG